MSGSFDKIEKVSALGESEGADGVNKLGKINEPVEGRFETLLKKPHEQIAEGNSELQKPTLEAVAANGPSLTVSAKDVIKQTEQINTQIESIKADLLTENLELKRPTAKLMQNKLTHIDDSLRVALSKAGMTESTQAEVVKPRQDLIPNPATQFFDHLTHSQDQLNNLGTYLEALVKTDKDLSPANMLSIQIKVNQIQQELEFFTNLLNKSLESTKALMNVQV